MLVNAPVKMRKLVMDPRSHRQTSGFVLLVIVMELPGKQLQSVLVN